MELSAHVCAQAFRDVLYESKDSFQSEISAAVQVVCRSINHISRVEFGIACESTGLTCALASDEACDINPLAYSRRRASWSRGRAAARIALNKLGITTRAGVGRGEAGEPIWPLGINGSITHCFPWSIAVATESFGSICLGIDLEDTSRIQEFEIETVVCRPAECEWVHEGENSLERLCMIFSAKEALYKSLFSSYRRYIDFAEVELRWCSEKRGFHVVTPPVGNSAQGQMSLIASRRCHNLVFSCAAYAKR